MANDAYRKYLEGEVLAADPVKLIRLLYDGAIDAVAQARLCLISGDIRGRGVAVNRAMAILSELLQSLDYSADGDLSGRLAAIYDFAQRRLLEGNFSRTDQPFEDAQRVLATLLEGWERCEPETLYSRNQAEEGMAGADLAYEPVSYAG